MSPSNTFPSFSVSSSSSSCLHPDFNKWFPFKISSLSSPPRLRLICFPGAGMEPLVFTGKGTARNPQPNPLVEFCSSENVELLAVQLPGPGRSNRHKEKCMESTKEVASTILTILRSLLIDDVPYVLLGHSMGCWCVYDLVRLIKEVNEDIKNTEEEGGGGGRQRRRRLLNLPLYLFLSCLISPDTPKELRPWKQNAKLNDEEFREESRGWDINEDVFKDEIWKMYEPLLRNDFALFDEYIFIPPPPSSSLSSSSSSLELNACLWFAENDKRIRKEDMENWRRILSGRGNEEEKRFEVREIKDANHSFMYDKNLREIWMKDVVDQMEIILLDIDYGC